MAAAYCFDVDAFTREDFELVAIINEDYTEFLQLSSRLQGVDEAVSSVRAPLQAILHRVDQAHEAMRKLQKRVQDQAAHARELQSAEADLQLSIRISEKLLVLEELLEIGSFEDAPEPQDESTDDDAESDDGFDNFELVRHKRIDGNASEVCASLERATQLLLQLDLEFLEGVDIPTVQREEKRIAVIEETLLRRLETELATEIVPDAFYNRDHRINAETLGFLLHSYVLLQKSHVPEDTIARLLVQPFAEENITRGKLDGRVRGSCEGLEQLFDEILAFVRTKFGHVLALPVCQAAHNKCSVDLLGNAIWKPLCETLTTKHAVIFKTADAERFHRNYTVSMAFLAKMEALCVSDAMRQRFRAHESVVAFKEQWNMDVYFQLRCNAMSARMEKSFGEVRTVERATSAETPPRLSLGFSSSRSLWTTLLECWDETSVYLSPLLPEFTKLSLQLVLHYATVWRDPISNAVSQLQTNSKAALANVGLSCLQTEEDVLSAAHDFHVIQSQILDDLFPVVKKHIEPFVDDADDFLTDLYQEVLAELSSLEDQCWAAGAMLVAEDCKKVLPALRTVKGQYQMTNKPAPTAPSTYVSNIIRPLAEFLDRWGSDLASDRRDALVESVLDPVCSMYATLSAELLKSAQELEDSLKSRKMQRSFVTDTRGADGLSDTAKMRLQLQLDLEEMKRLVKELDVELEQCAAFQEALAALEPAE
ncbi:hypothetical protein ATCC90586_001056 [Pythium insidiosum]|nr:hypothetical protein ATCC90586_001056 [Pythium insidiosum]